MAFKYSSNDKKPASVYFATKNEIAKILKNICAILRKNFTGINTPLSGMVGMADLLAHKLQESEYITFSKNIASAGRELINFFDNCIDIARSEHRDDFFSKEYFSLRSLINEIVELTNPAITHQKLLFTLEYPENIPEFFLGSRLGIYRIILNLLGNAIKFTNEGLVSIKVSYSEESPLAKKR